MWIHLNIGTLLYTTFQSAIFLVLHFCYFILKIYKKILLKFGIKDVTNLGSNKTQGVRVKLQVSGGGGGVTGKGTRHVRDNGG